MIRKLVIGLAAATITAGAHADITLGSYDFDSALFGDALVESDGGVYSASNWLNIANANPGNPAFLTGANFNTGIANIGGALLYTIGYGTSIVNGAGTDLGIVTARFSSDTIRMAVSQDGGTTNLGFLSFDGPDGSATGVACNYFYGGGGPFACELFVTEVDLSDYGVAPGASIDAVLISGSPELDLIRVAGFDTGDVNDVPEPASLLLAGLALLGMTAARRRRV